MKVVHLITRLDPGGSAENTLLTCHHLVEHGWQASLASGPGWTGKEASVEADVAVSYIPALRRDPSPVADARALWQIYRYLRRERPQIVHTHSAKAGILGRWAAWLAGVPAIVHTPHGHVLYGYGGGLASWIYRMAERITASITDRLVALSDGERRESAAAGIGRLDRWVVVPSGVDVDGVAPHESSVTPPLRIGCVARLEHVKGIDVLVRAAAELKRRDAPKVRILVWGDGRQHDEIVALRDALDVADIVELVGTDEPVTEFLRRLDVYVQPSRNEGMGRALVLAQAAGLPVVASRVCGIPDVVRDGETGILVTADDPAALADGIDRMVRQSPLRLACGTAARAWIMSEDETGFPRFSTDAMLWRLQRLYRELTDGP